VSRGCRLDTFGGSVNIEGVAGVPRAAGLRDGSVSPIMAGPLDGGA